MNVVHRFDFLDSLRGIAIMLMVLQHSALVLMDLSLVDSTPYIFMIILGIFAAPMFLILVGACLSISVEKRRERGETESEITSHVLKRGIILMVFGFLFMLIWEGEILRYIGMFILITYPMLKLQVKTRLILGTAIITLSPLLKQSLVLNGSEFLEGQFFQHSWYYSEFISRIYGAGYLTLFRWFSLVIFGSILGSLLVKSLKEGSGQEFQSTILKLGLILTGVGASEIFLAIPFDDFPAIYVICTMGVSLLVLFGLMWLSENKERAFRILNPLIVYGRLSLSIYVGHIIIWLGAFRLLGLTLDLSLLEVLTALLSCYIFTWVFGVLWLKIKPTGPLELIVARLGRVKFFD